MAGFVTVIGGGLAGCEAAYQLAKRGNHVRLFEMRPVKSTAVHKTGNLAELVCSNSLRSDDPFHPVGLLKREMESWDSLIIKAARANALPAGGALAVDRDGFSSFIKENLDQLNTVEVIHEEITCLPEGPAILAAGPLCSEALSDSLYKFLGSKALYFYDAIAPVVEYESINLDIAFPQSRYGKGDGEDYLNIPLDEQTYRRFVSDVLEADRVVDKAQEKMIYFEGCLPIEVMASRGEDTLRFGPMKPVGLTDPRTGKQPYAVIQLRQDNFAKSLWNLVGFQTQMKWPDQKRILRSLPGLESVKIVRHGMIHRNTYVNSPKYLDAMFRCKGRESLFLAGQISGVEGYVESAASGLMAGVHMARLLKSLPVNPFPPETAMGSLAHYVSFPGHQKFQPTNVNFGIIASKQVRKKSRKSDRRKAQVLEAISSMQVFAERLGEELCPVLDWNVGFSHS